MLEAKKEIRFLHSLIEFMNEFEDAHEKVLFICYLNSQAKTGKILGILKNKISEMNRHAGAFGYFIPIYFFLIN